MDKKKKSFDSKILAVVLLLFVLLGGGYYIAIFSTDSAREIGGGKDYGKLAENSEIYDSKVDTGKSGNAFFDKNDISNIQSQDKTADDLNSSLMRSDVREQARDNLSKGSSLSMASSVAAERIDNLNVDFSGGKSKSSVVEVDGTGGEDMVMGGTGAEYKRKGGIMDELKRALYLSEEAVSDFSAEGAEDKLSNIFDPHNSLNALTSSTSGGGSVAADVGDLNALPKFLRSQDGLDDSKVSGSKVSAMGESSEYDMDPDTVNLNDSIKEPTAFDKAVGKVFPGMMNPIFIGIIPRYAPPERSPYEIGYSNLSSGRPGDIPSMLSIDDEDLIVYGSKQGFQVVYDMKGNFIGCMDNATMMFKAAGSPGCPR